MGCFYVPLDTSEGLGCWHTTFLAVTGGKQLAVEVIHSLVLITGAVILWRQEKVLGSGLGKVGRRRGRGA